MFTLSVRSFHVPATPLHLGLAAQLAVAAHFLGDARHFRGERSELVHHRVHRGADAEELALDGLAVDLERHLLGQVTLGHRDQHARHFRGGQHQVADQRVDGVDAGGPAPPHVSERHALAHAALAADHALHADHLVREGGVAAHQRVEGVGDLIQQPPARALGQAHAEVASLGRLEGREQREQRVTRPGPTRGLERAPGACRDVLPVAVAPGAMAVTGAVAPGAGGERGGRLLCGAIALHRAITLYRAAVAALLAISGGVVVRVQEMNLSDGWGGRVSAKERVYPKANFQRSSEPCRPSSEPALVNGSELNLIRGPTLLVNFEGCGPGANALRGPELCTGARHSLERRGSARGAAGKAS